VTSFFDFKVRKVGVKNREINPERDLSGSKLNLYNSEMMIHSTFFLRMLWLKGHSEYKKQSGGGNRCH
jgi:hypothetical protein